jgi:hypothetical protein
VKARHWAGVNASLEPPGSFESRIATMPRLRATSTHSPLELLCVLFRQLAIATIPHLLYQ